MNYPYSTQQTTPSGGKGWDATTRLVVIIFLIILFGIAMSAFRAIIVPLVVALITAYLLHPAGRACRTR
jgi:predicted PurR-regulated permease PerM